MNVFDQAIGRLVEKENEYQLDSVNISGVPIWNIMKYDVRRCYLVQNGLCESVQSNHSSIRWHESLAGMWQAFVMVCRLFFRTLKVDNLIMGFSRLENISGCYFDKFIDPVIKLSELKDNYIYFEYGRIGLHPQPRENRERIVYADFIYLLSFVWGYMAAAYYQWRYHQGIVRLEDSINKATGVRLSSFGIARQIAEFKCKCLIFSRIMSKLGIKRVFGVSRILFKPVAFAAKKRGLTVFEFQHGITMGETGLYSGNYIPSIDPDYFLLFGESCPRNVFGVPSDQTINIGWAFKQYLKSSALEDYRHNCCLVISEPQISNMIIDATLALAQAYPNIQFHIRRHPQEQFSKEQNKRLAGVENVKDATNRKNSFLVSMSYEYIIGENSTVLYEALSLGKKVARLNLCGLGPVNRNCNDAFYYIDQVEDFAEYMNGPIKIQEKPVYSDFNANLFNSLLVLYGN